MEEEQNIETLIKSVRDEKLRINLDQIKEGSKAIWSPSRRIIDDFTDHGITHSNRIAGYIIKLIYLNKGKKPLSDTELYTLSASICLHDIGMQCDIAYYPIVKEISENKFHARFDTEFKATKSSDYSQEEQRSIRENHNRLTAAWIEFIYGNTSVMEDTLSIAIKSIPGRLVGDIVDVCLFHSKLDINTCDKNFRLEKTSRKQFIAALLRFADELDIDWNRVSDDAYNAFRIPPSNKLYWWLHNQTTVEFNMDNNSILVTLAINPADFNNYGQLIRDIYLDPFKRKNEQVLSVLIKNDVPVSIDLEIKKHDYTEKMPEEIAQAMILLSDQMAKKEILSGDAIFSKAEVPSDSDLDEEREEYSAKEYYLEDVKDLLPTSELSLTSLYIYFKLTKQEARWTCIANEIITQLLDMCDPPTFQIEIYVNREFSTAKSLLLLLHRLGISTLIEFDELLKGASNWGGKLIKKVFMADIEDLLSQQDFGSAVFWFSPFHIMILFVIYAKKYIILDNPAILEDLLIPFDRKMLLQIVKEDLSAQSMLNE